VHTRASNVKTSLLTPLFLSQSSFALTPRHQQLHLASLDSTRIPSPPCSSHASNPDVQRERECIIFIKKSSPRRAPPCPKRSSIVPSKNTAGSRRVILRITPTSPTASSTCYPIATRPKQTLPARLAWSRLLRTERRFERSRSMEAASIPPATCDRQ
jgi:hypothetical protein